MKGKFITFEGCEGVGKSRQISMLCEYLDRAGADYTVTREPGGAPISEKIRKIILDGANSEMVGECEALLYAASRVQHINDTIAPSLAAGKLVICDRYIDSSFAYQAYARGLGYQFIDEINRRATSAFMPELTLFLDLPPEKAFARKGGADKGDRLELSGMEFHKKVYEGYLNVCEKFPERIVRIDCSGEKAQTHAKILAALSAKGIL